MGGVAVIPHRTLAARMRGLSLIELMIAMLLSSLVLLGLLTLMNNVGSSNRAQDGLARLQENGRYAVQQLARDLREAGNQFCSRYAVAASFLEPGAGKFMDAMRAPRVRFDASGLGLNPDAKTAQYELNPRYFLYGSECGTSSCAPALTGVDRGIPKPALPAMGITAGSRARGADVVSFRYLRGDGVDVRRQEKWLAGDGATTIQVASSADADSLDIDATNNALLVTDCSTAEMVKVTQAGAVFTLSGNFDDDAMTAMPVERPGVSGANRGSVRAFNLARDFTQVSYYLALKADPNQPGRLISSLYRREGTNAAQELVEGVERLDFLYGIDDKLGRTRFLTATEVDALTSADCPPSPIATLTPATFTDAAGCGWRAVHSIDVMMLLNTVADVSSNNTDEFRYAYLNDGSVNSTGTFESPKTLGTLRNGLPPGRMLRREFRARVALRGVNF